MGSFLFEILDFIVLALFIVGVLRKIGSLFRPTQINIKTTAGAPSASRESTPHRAEMARDPVCGMFVSTELPHQLRHGKEVLHFCSEECLLRFQKDSEHVAS
jgi:YHS domain-containing protein